MSVIKYAIKIKNLDDTTDVKTLITSYVLNQQKAKLSVFNTKPDEVVFFARNNMVYDYVLFISEIYQKAFFIIATSSGKNKNIIIVNNGEILFDINERML